MGQSASRVGGDGNGEFTAVKLRDQLKRCLALGNDTKVRLGGNVNDDVFGEPADFVFEPVLGGNVNDDVYGEPADFVYGADEVDGQFPMQDLYTGTTRGGLPIDAYDNVYSIPYLSYGAQGVQGGAGNSTSDVAQYGDQVFTKNKEQLIRKIAHGVFSALKMAKAGNAKTASLPNVVNALNKMIPSAQSLTDSAFARNSKKQTEACDALANAVNAAYGTTLIDLSGSPQARCKRVAEVLRTLLTGLNSEFMGVATSISRTLRNLRILLEMIDASYDRQVKLLRRTGQTDLTSASESVSEFYEKIRDEVKRQIALLSNMLNVSIGETGKSLVAMLEGNDDFPTLIEAIDAEPGTPEFANKVAYMLSGANTVAQAAAKVKRALKRLNMSLAEFKKLREKGTTAMRIGLLEHALVDSRDDPEIFAKRMRAIAVLKRLGPDSKIVAAVKGGNWEPLRKAAASFSENLARANNVVQGGDDYSFGFGTSFDVNDDDDSGQYSGHWNRKSIRARLDRQKKFRNVILHDFKHFVKQYFRAIVVASSTIAENIRTAVIPVDDDLRKFVAMFNNLQDFNHENLHVALSGYPRDTRSKEIREQFFDRYNLVSESLQPLLKGSGGRIFQQLQTAITAMLRALDAFKDKMAAAITQLTLTRPEEQLEFVRDTNRIIFGSSHDYNPGVNLTSTLNDVAADNPSYSGLGAVSGGGIAQQNTYIELARVKREMEYFIAIANIKRNLRVQASETSNFSKGYEQMLGEEAGYFINQIQAEFTALIDETDPAIDKTPANEHAKYIHKCLRDDHLTNSDIVADNKTSAQLAYTQLCRLWKRQLRSKVKLINVAQAVDLYLKSFADAIARHPDSVSDIVKMLDSVEMVAKWFTDKSGDTLASVFESFPCGFDAKDEPIYNEFDGQPIIGADGSIARFKSDDGKHYYQRLNEAWEADNNHLPGNPALGRPMGDAHGAKAQDSVYRLTHEAVNSVRALENILSAFKSVGEKFGNIVPQNDTFMNPGQIYSALVEYITMSAFSSEYLPNYEEQKTTSLHYSGRVDASDLEFTNGVRQSIPADGVQAHFHANSNMSVQDMAHQINEHNTGMSINTTDGVLTGVSNRREVDSTKARMRKVASLALCGLPDTTGRESNFWQYHNPDDRSAHVSLNGWRDAFYDTDQLFQMVIKSVVAKVFIVVDAYRLFHCPTIDRRTHDSLSPIRTILGGGVTAKQPKVIPNALELYLRLPLLAEWYRDKYGFKDGRKSNNGWQLSLVPSFGGVWSDFIALIFDKTEYIVDGNYSEYQVSQIISTINGVYEHYKRRTKNKFSCRDVINAFVVEINRVFGFLKQSEIDLYLKERREYIDSNRDVADYGSVNDNVHYDILDSEEQFTHAVAPSDRYVTDSASKRKLSNKKRSRVHILAEIEKIRMAMDIEFRSFTSDNKDRAYSFADTLRNYAQEIKSAKESDRYNIISGMIQGSNRFIAVNANLLIIVHECVSAPLQVLYHTYTIMSKFNALLHGTSVQHLTRWFTEFETAGNIPATAAQLATSYELFLNDAKCYPDTKSRKNIVKLFASALVSGAYVNIGGGQRGLKRIDAGLLARDLLNATVGLCSNPARLVQCSAGRGSKLQLDLSPLQDMCETLLIQVKSNINRLRINFNSGDVLSRHEKIDCVGSVRWLEENLINVLFKNRDRSGLPLAVTNHIHASMLALGDSTKMNSCAAGLRELVYYGENSARFKATVQHNDLTAFPFNVMPLKIDASTYTSEMKAALNEMRPGTQVMTTANGLTLVNSALVVPLAVAPVADWGLANQSKSLFLAFNDILQKYIADAYDENTMKIYLPVFESFMNGAAAREVTQNQGFPDVGKLVHATYNHVSNVIFGAGDMKGPSVQSLVFASNAQTMRGLASNMDVRLKKRRHVFETLAEVPEHVRDRMKCTLPYYKTILANLSARADILRRILANTAIRKNMAAGAIANEIDVNAAAADASSSNIVMKTISGLTSENNASYQVAILNRLYDLANGLRKCAERTYSELRDHDQFFMNTSKDFIADYKSNYGVLPIMPASHALLPQIACNGRVADWAAHLDTESHVLLPTKLAGSNVYKFNYASRLVLGNFSSSVTMAHLPGAGDIYRDYAATAEQRGMLSERDHNNTILGMFQLLRFNAVAAAYGRLYSHRQGNNQAYTTASPETGVVHVHDFIRSIARNNDASEVTDATMQAVNGGNVYDDVFDAYYDELDTPPVALSATNTPKNAQAEVFAQKYGLRGVMQLVENTNKPSAKDELALILQVASETKSDSRSRMRVFNILDMGIVPLNVHAFSREAPFVHLLNCAYTFDSMVHNFIIPKYMSKIMQSHENGSLPNTLLIGAGDSIASTREMLIKMLCHPYADITRDSEYQTSQYYSLLGSLYSGNDDLKLGVPRYLNDQLWNKVLLTSSAQIVAGQLILQTANVPAANDMTNYPDNFGSVEVGPAAFEAVRGVVHFSAEVDEHKLITDKLQSVHGAKLLMDQYRNTLKQLLRATLGNIAAGGQNYDEYVDFVWDMDQKVPDAVIQTIFISLSNLLDDTTVIRFVDIIVRVLESAAPFLDSVNKTLKWFVQHVTSNAAKATIHAKYVRGHVIWVSLQANHPNVIDAGTAAQAQNLFMAATGFNAANAPATVVNDAHGWLMKMLEWCVAENALEASYLVAIKRGLNNEHGSANLVHTLITRAFTGVAHATYVPMLRCLLTETFIILHNAVELVLNTVKLGDAFNAADDKANGSHLLVASDPVSTPGLKFFDRKKQRWTVPVGNQMLSGTVVHLAELGKVRNDTKLVRDVAWLTILQRTMRAILVDHLKTIQSPVVHGVSLANQDMTEYRGNEHYDPARFQVPEHFQVP